MKYVDGLKVLFGRISDSSANKNQSKPEVESWKSIFGIQAAKEKIKLKQLVIPGLKFVEIFGYVRNTY